MDNGADHRAIDGPVHNGDDQSVYQDGDGLGGKAADKIGSQQYGEGVGVAHDQDAVQSGGERPDHKAVDGTDHNDGPLPER